MYSDNNPVTYMLSTAKLNATDDRWVSELGDFNLKVRYLQVKKIVMLITCLDFPWISKSA